MNPLRAIIGIPQQLRRLGVGSLRRSTSAEQTQRQSFADARSVEVLARAQLIAAGYSELVQGDAETFPPNYATWRLMSRNPTLALAKAVAVAPILSASWSYEGRDKSVPDEMIAFARGMLDPLREAYLEDAARALEVGWAPFEVIWKLTTEAKDGLPTPRWEICRLKPLMPELSVPIYAPISGELLGVRNRLVSLTLGKSLIYTCESVAGNVLGIPRHENVREEYSEYRELRAARRALARKVAGVIPIVRYLKGKAIDPVTKQPVDNYILAQKLLGALASARGVTFESAAIDADDLRGNPELLKLSNFAIDTVDTGNSGQAIAPMLAHAQHLESLMMRGWLQPERSALQGQHGTNAEAETHSKLGVGDSERVHRQMVRPVQAALDDALELNFGSSARGAVTISPAPLVDSKREVLEQLYQAMLRNPGILEVLLSEIDRDQVYDRLELPKLDQVAGATPDASAVADPVASPVGIPGVPPAQQTAQPGTQTEAAAGGTSATAPAPELALNGAQVSSGIDVLLRLRTGEIVPVAATEILVGMGIPQARVDRMVQATVAAGPLPTQTTAPASVPPTPSPAAKPPANTNPGNTEPASVVQS